MSETVGCVIYESVLNGAAKFQQLSNLSLSGFSTNEDTLNTDNGLLYGSFTFAASTYTLNLYKDVAKTQRVATASSGTIGVKAITAVNGSGITGSVNFAQYLADDNNINVLCFLSRDRDLGMNNLEVLADYDAANGFAFFHLRAFDKIKEFIIADYKSLVWKPEYIDTTQINRPAGVAGTGGYDLSRVLNWKALREAAAYYALYLLCERQNFDEQAIFAKRAKESLARFNNYLKSVEVDFDTNGDRVEDKSRSFATFKIGRA